MNLQISAPTLQAPQTLPIRKLFHWLPDGSLQLRIDWSSIESFLGCNRSAEYRLVYSRSSRPGSALVFGAAMHSALEVWYKRSPADHHPDTLLQCRVAIDRTFAEYPGVFFNDYRTSDYCFESFLKYIDYYKEERLTPHTYEGNKLVEFSFSYPLGKAELPIGVFDQQGFGVVTNDAEAEKALYAARGGNATVPVSIEWTGIIDMLASLNGELWVMDHKTTSILSQDFFDGFEIAMQPTGYVTAARAAFPNLNIKGFIVNVLACRKPTEAKTKSGKDSKAKPFEPYRRMYHYESWHEEEFKRDALALIQEFLANLCDHYFPRKTQWCIGKYGKCPYFECCSLKPEQRSLMLASGNYVDNTWKPV